MDQGTKCRADTDVVVHSGRQLWQQNGIAHGALCAYFPHKMVYASSQCRLCALGTVLMSNKDSYSFL